MNAKIDLEKFICSYVKYSNIQDALKDQGLKCWNGEIVEIPQESEDEEVRQAMINFFKSERIKDGIAVLHFGVNIEKMISWLEKQGEKPQVDGFDAELNALLKKYEYLPNDEMVECLKFYTAELINNKQRIEKK